MILSFFCSAAQVYSSAEPKLFVQISKLLMYAKHHQCNACHLRNEHGLLIFYFSPMATPHSVLFVFCLLFIIRRISQQVFKPDRGDLLKKICLGFKERGTW